jgi:hypothetical protein
MSTTGTGDGVGPRSGLLQIARSQTCSIPGPLMIRSHRRRTLRHVAADWSGLRQVVAVVIVEKVAQFETEGVSDFVAAVQPWERADQHDAETVAAWGDRQGTGCGPRGPDTEPRLLAAGHDATTRMLEGGHDPLTRFSLRQSRLLSGGGSWPLTRSSGWASQASANWSSIHFSTSLGAVHHATGDSGALRPSNSRAPESECWASGRRKHFGDLGQGQQTSARCSLRVGSATPLRIHHSIGVAGTHQTATLSSWNHNRSSTRSSGERAGNFARRPGYRRQTWRRADEERLSRFANRQS